MCATDIPDMLSTSATFAFRAWNSSHPRHLPGAACALSTSHAQHLEDLLLLRLILRTTSGGSGTFVELGANDGMTMSNTLALERCYNWTGLLIEGQPENYRRLANNSAVHRHRSHIVHSAVCSSANSSTNISARGDGMAADMTTMDSTRWKHYRQRLAYSWERLSSHSAAAAPVVSVPCAPLSEIMHQWGAASANFLSLDVEGAEHLVLRTVNPASFEVIVVEQDGLNPRKDDAVTEQILTSGLRQVILPSIRNSGVYVSAHLCDSGVNKTHLRYFHERCGTRCVPGRKPNMRTLDGWLRQAVVCSQRRARPD